MESAKLTDEEIERELIRRAEAEGHDALLKLTRYVCSHLDPARDGHWIGGSSVDWAIERLEAAAKDAIDQSCLHQYLLPLREPAH